MNDFALGSSLPPAFINDTIHGPTRDAAEFMAELQEETPEIYDTWLRLRTREDFNEKFRRSFISALCKFCINRKQMELARYRRDFVAAVLAFTKADIGVNVFCDKNGGGYLNNSLKSRRAYQKRRRETNWQEQAAAVAVNESTFSTLLRSFQQHSTPPAAQRRSSVAQLLAHADSSEPVRLRSPSPLIPPLSGVRIPTVGSLLTCEPPEESKERSASSCASASSSSTSIVSVFVRYRTVSEDWKDMNVKQIKLTLHSFATVETLYSALVSKFHLDNEELVLRAYDRDFGEFVDIEEKFSSISVENLSKFELVHRCSPTHVSVLGHQGREQTAGSESGPSENRTPCSTRSASPPPAVSGLVGLLNEMAVPKSEKDSWSKTLRNAAALLGRPAAKEVDEADTKSGKFGPDSALFQSSLFEVENSTEPLEKMNETHDEFTPIDLLSIFSKSDYGRLLLQLAPTPIEVQQPLSRKRPRPVSP